MCLDLSARYIRKLAGSIFGLALDTQLSYTNYLKTILNNNPKVQSSNNPKL